MGATLSRRHGTHTPHACSPTDPGWLLLLHGQPLWNDAALALTPSVHSDHQQAGTWALGTSENLPEAACSVSPTVPDMAQTPPGTRCHRRGICCALSGIRHTEGVLGGATQGNSVSALWRMEVSREIARAECREARAGPDVEEGL